MNELYVEQVCKAHELCKELVAMEANTGLNEAYYNKANDFLEYVLSCDSEDWYVPVHMFKNALTNYKIAFDVMKCPSFDKFFLKYNNKIMETLELNTDQTSNERKYFLTGELAYLADIKL